MFVSLENPFTNETPTYGAGLALLVEEERPQNPELSCCLREGLSSRLSSGKLCF
jgi:hypothetical protein